MKSNNPSGYREDKTFPDNVFVCVRVYVCGFFWGGGGERKRAYSGEKKVTERIPHLTWEWY